MTLSVVTTLFGSAGYIDEFHRRLTAAITQITDDYEVVMVDDGSTDESLAVARRLADRDVRVRVVELSRNFGHHRAMMAGLDAAAGDFVLLMDVDLEEDPAWVIRFWDERLRVGADVVYGFQEARKGGLVERLGGRLHWWLIGALSSYSIPQNLVTARLMTRQYVDALLLHREQKTAIGGLWAITGFRQIGLPVTKGSRGRSSYSLTQRIARGLDGLTSFSEKPLILIFLLGLGIFAAALLGGAYLIVLRLSGVVALSGYSSLIVSIWLLGGLAIACIGVVGLYTARIFIETKHRPYVIVKNTYQNRQVPPV